MYYIVYGILYLFSLLPFFVLYLFSDLIFFLIYHVMKYRKHVVLENLSMVFPEKKGEDIEALARQFYRDFSDSIVEIIKLFSMSERAFNRRVSMDLSVCREYERQGRNIHYHTGHQMNWEYGNHALTLNSGIPAVNVYLRLNSKVMDSVIYRMRTRFHNILVPAQEFREQSVKFMKNQYALGLIADQSPPGGDAGYWLNYFGKPTAFITGPDKGARRLDPVIVFVNCVKIKRGYYRYEAKLVTDHGRSMAEGELTRLYRDFLEEGIRRNPSNYLWSHRRWKIQYKSEYRNRWIDSSEPPVA